MIKYPSVSQYRNTIREVTRHGAMPLLTFKGTVKLHGTNASVVIAPNDDIILQSRNKEIRIGDDNQGFAAWASLYEYEFLRYKQDLISSNLVGSNDTVVIYGEFAGQQISPNVAVSGLPKFFYTFGVKLVNGDDSKWIDNRPEFKSSLDCITDCLTIWSQSIEIDFANPEKVQNQLIDITEKIEAECPVGKFFGNLGIGEGVVWEHISDSGELLSFKIKGEKHSISKVKTLAPVDVEKLNSIMEFIEYAVTENRLNQAAAEILPNVPHHKLAQTDNLLDFDRQYLSAFIQWVNNDIAKEESDVIKDNSLEMRDISKGTSAKARAWFFQQEIL